MTEETGRVLPLSPPRKILSRLTPLRFASAEERAEIMMSSPPRKTPRLTTHRSGTKRRTLSSGEVLDRVSKFREERQVEIERRQEQFHRRLENASENRKMALEGIQENARRFSNNARIWGKYKFKVGKDDVESSDADEKGEQGCFKTHSLQIKIIKGSLERYLGKQKILNSSLLATQISKALKLNTFGEVTTLANSPEFKHQVRITLEFYKTPQLSVQLPNSHIFIYSIIMLGDYRLSSGLERAYDTTLGKYAIQEFKGFGMEGFMELHLHDDVFYLFIVGKYLRVSRKMLTSFRSLIASTNGLYCSAHLKFLNIWREYIDIFHVFTNFHTKRSLLLLTKALDLLESGIAVQEHMGLRPLYEYKRRDIFKRQKQGLEKQIILNDKRNEDPNHDWFSLGRTLQERVSLLFDQYEKYEDSKTLLDHNLIIPPGFTVFEWRRFRTNRVINELKPQGKELMKTGHAAPISRERFGIEKEMKRIGLMSFRSCTEQCLNERDLVELSKMLIGCIGKEINDEQSKVVEGLMNGVEEEEYLANVQVLINELLPSGYNYRLWSTRTEYLKTWRELMNHFTTLWIDSSINRTPSFLDFENKLFKYELAKRCNLSIDEYVEELRLEIPQRSNVSWRVLVLEHIILKKGAIEELRTVEVIKPKLRNLFQDLDNVVNRWVIMLHCLPDHGWEMGSGEDRDPCLKIFQSLYQLAPKDIACLEELKQLIEFNFYVYQDLYERLAS